MPRAQLGDFADSSANGIKMARAARIGVIEWAQPVRQAFAFVELHRIGNVVRLSLNEAVGLIIERRKCLRGARRQIRPVREVLGECEALGKCKGRGSNTYKEYGQNDPDSHLGIPLLGWILDFLMGKHYA